MDLILTTPGTHISVKDYIFLIKSGELKEKLSPVRVNRIIVSTEASFTTAAIVLCAENNIDFVIIDHHGNPIGRFWHSKFGSVTTIRRKQLEIAEHSNGLDIVKEWIKQKIGDQIEFVNELAKNRSKLKDKILEKCNTLNNNLKKIYLLEGDLDSKRGTIQGIEGSSSRIYFEILSMAIPESFHFKGRSRQPAKDHFNAFLNYSYGVLYSEVEKALILSGLDPFIGFLHTDNYNKKSLVFDIIENFRIDSDRVVFHLFSKKLVNKKMVDSFKDGVSLNKEGKRLLFDERRKYYDKVVRYGNKNMKRSDIIQSFCHKFANTLLED